VKHHSIRLLFVIVAPALAALIVADLVREARGRRLRETILAALQPVAFAPVAAIHDVVDRAGYSTLSLRAMTREWPALPQLPISRTDPLILPTTAR
jgi:hypothetical protein